MTSLSTKEDATQEAIRQGCLAPDGTKCLKFRLPVPRGDTCLRCLTEPKVRALLGRAGSGRPGFPPCVGAGEPVQDVDLRWFRACPKHGEPVPLCLCRKCEPVVLVVRPEVEDEDAGLTERLNKAGVRRADLVIPSPRPEPERNYVEQWRRVYGEPTAIMRWSDR